MATIVLPKPIVSLGSDDQPEIIVRPMLTTAQKNFKKVGDCQSILARKIPDNIARQELNVPGSRCFLLHNLLTAEECSHYIQETERIGYSDLSGLFSAEYRSNDRVLSLCEQLVDCLWKRIEIFLTRKEVIRVRPIGFGNEGTWKPFRLNECCKFGKYKSGGHFSPHIDGPWVPHEDESSVFTVVVYLNADFEGGATNFISEDGVGEVVCSVLPKTGTALIFNHDTLHEGRPVTMGTKYIIRTEIMYRRVDREMILDPMAYQSDENYIKTLALYRKSWQLERAGDIKGFTDTYLEAIKFQQQVQRSVSRDSIEIFEQLLPYEVHMKIFGYLTAKDVCTIMTVCKAWYDMAMDGQLWYNLYRRRWPIGIKLEAQLDHTKKTLKQEPGPFIKDWYGLYKQRVALAQPKKVVVLDLGSFSCKCAAIHRNNCTIKTSCTESVVAKAPGVFDLHMRRGEYERYFCGKEAKEKFPEYIVNVIEKGVPSKQAIQMLPEIITGFYYDCRVRPKYSPVVILEPPGGLWNNEIRGKVAYSFLRQFMQPSVSFLSTTVAILCGMDLTSGVVLDVGYGIVTCAAMWKGEEFPKTVSCDPDEATPIKLADMVHRVVSKASKDAEMESTLIEHIVVTGGEAKNVDQLRKELLKKDKGYRVLEPGDKIYAAVKGGCTFAAISIFEAFCADSKSSDFYEKRGRGHPFYNFCVRPQYWLTGLSTKVEIEQEIGCKYEYGLDPYVDSDDEGERESGSQSTSGSDSEAKSQSDSECEDQGGEASEEDTSKGDLDSQAGSLPEVNEQEK